MIPVPPPRLWNVPGSDPGDRLGLPAGRVLGGLEVTGGHLDPEHAIAAVADEVERLRPDDLTGNCLPVPAALTRDDSSHHSSAGPANPVRKTSSFPPPLGHSAQSTAPRHRRCRFAIRAGRRPQRPSERGLVRAPGAAPSRTPGPPPR